MLELFANLILRYLQSKVEQVKGAWRKLKNFPRRVKEFFKAMPPWFRALPMRLKGATPYDAKIFLMGHGRMGQGSKRGFIPTAAVYILAIPFAFVFLYPLFYMFGHSFMNPADLVNPLIRYLPTSFHRENFRQAMRVLEFWPTLWHSFWLSGVSALLQTVAASLLSYGLARYRFPGKKIIFSLILITFLLPPQILIMPQIITFRTLRLINTDLAYFLPALLGQGIRSAVFILVFYQFYRAIPRSLEEAAKIDGANAFMVYVKVAIPLTIPAYLLSFLLSFVWYYNESVLNVLFLSSNTLIGQLDRFRESFADIFSAQNLAVSEATYMAGTLLCILPLILLYFVTQNFFVQGIDRSGLTGE